MEFNAKECGLRIKNLRTANGLRQIELCDRVYMSERNLRRIERGETDNNTVAKREILKVISDLTAIAREL